MDENTLASYLYDYGMASCADIGDTDPEERNIWLGFLASLEQACRETGCDANTAVLLQSNQEDKVCGFHREYGYYYVSCGDRGEWYLVILEQNRDEAMNLFLERIFDKVAYEYALLRRKDEEKAWPYHCRFDYRKIWFGQALHWLAPVVDWQFFVECAGRYVELLNRWFAVPHWEYDFELGRLIESDDSWANIEVRFYDSPPDHLLKFAVIAAKYQEKWVVCKHRERDTYEFPGGHREPGETIEETAKRELYEETGAVRYEMRPVCGYSVTRYSREGAPDEESFGMLFSCEVFQFGELPPDFEMEKIELFEKIPDNWTYPDIQPFLLEYLMENEKK